MAFMLTSCSAEEPSTFPGEVQKVTILQYGYEVYNYEPGIGNQYFISVNLVNSSGVPASGSIVFNFTDDGPRSNDILIPYSLEPGQARTLAFESPIFITYGADLIDVTLAKYGGL